MLIVSSASLLGYIMAAFTPRKQALHDLMSATYVVREGPARVIPALAVAVAGREGATLQLGAGDFVGEVDLFQGCQ